MCVTTCIYRRAILGLRVRNALMRRPMASAVAQVCDTFDFSLLLYGLRS